jgi:diacylglycerol O-acyltransferase
MRYQRVPFDVHHPAWVDDDRFDIDYHVRQAQLPGPGPASSARTARPAAVVTSRQLAPAVGDVPDQRAGARSQRAVHQDPPRSVDGMSGFQLLTTLVDLAPEPEDIGAPEPWTPARRPGSIGMLWNAASTTSRIRSRCRAALPGSRPTSRPRCSAPALPARCSGPPWRRRAPSTASSRHVASYVSSNSTSRAYSPSRTPRVKVNDVAIGLIGGGLRRHLERIGHPTDSVVW